MAITAPRGNVIGCSALRLADNHLTTDTGSVGTVAKLETTITCHWWSVVTDALQSAAAIRLQQAELAGRSTGSHIPPHDSGPLWT
jgi:hypothetical protein